MSAVVDRDLIAGALAAFLVVASIPAGIQLHRAVRMGDCARVGLHGVKFAGALVAAALLLWWRP